MKKITACILLAFMILSVCGCSADKSDQGQTLDGNSSDGFQVGYGRVDITPSESVPISGVGRSSMRMSTSIHDRLYATCIAVTDAEGETVLMYSLDTQHSYYYVFDHARLLVSESLGIPQDHIYFTATHTHSGPDLSNSQEASILTYREQVIQSTLEAAKAAIADKAPAVFSYGSVETEGMNFVRHYVSTNPDGSLNYFGDNYGTGVIDSTTRHTTQADTTMHVVRVEREGQKDIVMVNWRSHPHLFTSANSYKLSADFIGSFRSAMEDLNDCYFAYFQGAAGNINTNSRIIDENKVLNEDYGQYGYVMAQYCMEALEQMTPASGVDIKTVQVQKVLEADHEEDHLVSYAAIVQAAWNSGSTASEATALGAAYGIHSPYHANYIIANSKRADTLTSELNAVAIGDAIAFVTAPHELFDTQSVWVEEYSPYPMTMMFCYTNGANSYVPSDYVYEYGSYECDAAYAVRGTAEILQEEYLQMLESLSDD